MSRELSKNSNLRLSTVNLLMTSTLFLMHIHAGMSVVLIDKNEFATFVNIS